MAQINKEYLKFRTCAACIRRFFIGPCHAQQRGRSRAQTQHEGGSRVPYPDHEERAWARGTLWPGQVIRILGCTSPPLPLPPIRATRTEPPPNPFRYILLPLPKCQLRPASEENTLQPLVWGQSHGLSKRRMWRPFWSFQHFSRRSDSRANDQRRLTSALLYSWMRNPWQASTTGQVHGRPVQDRGLYKESPCTFLPLSYNTRRRPHPQTPRRETLPTSSEGEQTVVMICRPNSKISPFYWCRFDLCSLFFVLCSFMHRF